MEETQNEHKTIAKIVPVIDMSETGRKITQLRDEAGLSSRDLARRMDVSYQAAYRWEHGTSIPSIDNLFVLAFILGCSVDDIVATKLMPVSIPTRLKP